MSAVGIFVPLVVGIGRYHRHKQRLTRVIILIVKAARLRINGRRPAGLNPRNESERQRVDYK